jgi:type I restriction enzyme S subunit
VGKLGDDFKIKMGQSPSGDTYNEIGLGMPFYQGRTDFGFRFPKIRMYCTDPKRIALRGDTLISVRAPVGDQNIAIEDCCIGRGVGSLRHTSDSISYTYYRIYFLQESLQAYNGEGTVFGSINQDSLNGIKQIIPNLKLIEKFETLSSPLDLKILAQEKKITQLTTLRDSLLPKLISGELDLSDKMISAILEPAK